MTHLSDGSYVQRAVGLLLGLVFELWLIFRKDGLKAFNVAKSSVRVKAISTLMLLVSQILMLSYEFVSMVFKYTEGYSLVNGNVLAKPSASYSDADKALVFDANNILNVSWALKSSALFLCMAVWNFSVCSLMDFSFFKKSWEFRSYIIYSAISFVMYFVLQQVFLSNSLLSTVAPQVVYHCECLLLCAILTLTNRRFSSYAARTQPTVAARIMRYVRVNQYLIGTVFVDGLSLLIINADILAYPTQGAKRVIYNSKFATDLLSAFFSTSFSLAYPLAILNLYPLPATLNRGSAREEGSQSKRHGDAPATAAAGSGGAGSAGGGAETANTSTPGSDKPALQLAQQGGAPAVMEMAPLSPSPQAEHSPSPSAPTQRPPAGPSVATSATPRNSHAV